MTDTTTTRPLPVDLDLLRQHWLPAEPESTVTAALAALRRIDALIVSTAAELDQRDQTDRALVGDLVDAAIAGDNLDQPAARVGQLGDRPALTFASSSYATPATSAPIATPRRSAPNPDYVAWQQECARITTEWQSVCQTAETPEARYNALIVFAQLHSPLGVLLAGSSRPPDTFVNLDESTLLRAADTR